MKKLHIQLCTNSAVITYSFVNECDEYRGGDADNDFDDSSNRVSLCDSRFKSRCGDKIQQIIITLI